MEHTINPVVQERTEKAQKAISELRAKQAEKLASERAAVMVEEPEAATTEETPTS